MKILHTGDWHIGKLIHGIHMTEDQKVVLNQLIELIKKEEPDVLIVAGDLYDRSVPPIEAVELLDDVLTKIVMEEKVKVMAIAGNHDSSDRVGFASKILRDKGLYISGHIHDEIQPIVMEDDFGPVNFYLIPYAEPAVVRELYGDEKIRNHNDAMSAIINRIKKTMSRKERNVCIAHAYLMGIDQDTLSESVRPLSIGGSEYVDVSHFDGFDYVALGHLHRPQKVKSERIRYAGSLMKYSFSETNQKKSVGIIHLDEKKIKDESTYSEDEGCQISIDLHKLNPDKDMRIIKGQLENLVDSTVYKGTNTEDYIMAILTDEGELIDPIVSLRAVYPNVLRVEKEFYDRQVGEDQTSAGESYKKKDPLQLFEEFYENISGDVFDEEKSRLVTKVVDGLIEKGRKI